MPTFQGPRINFPQNAQRYDSFKFSSHGRQTVLQGMLLSFKFINQNHVSRAYWPHFWHANHSSSKCKVSSMQCSLKHACVLYNNIKKQFSWDELEEIASINGILSIMCLVAYTHNFIHIILCELRCLSTLWRSEEVVIVLFGT